MYGFKTLFEGGLSARKNCLPIRRSIANTLSGAVTIDTSSQPNKLYGKEMAMKACTDLQSGKSTMEDMQDFLDQKLSQYLER